MFCKKWEHDVDAALEMLKNFSAILFVDTYENDLVVMRDKFWWQDVDITTHRWGSKRNSSATEELDPRLRLLLEHDLKKDILFYQKARDIAREINTL